MISRAVISRGLQSAGARLVVELAFRPASKPIVCLSSLADFSPRGPAVFLRKLFSHDKGSPSLSNFVILSEVSVVNVVEGPLLSRKCWGCHPPPTSVREAPAVFLRKLFNRGKGGSTTL